MACGSGSIADAEHKRKKPVKAPTITVVPIPFKAIGPNVFRMRIGDPEKVFFEKTGCIAESVTSTVGYKDYAGEAWITYVCAPDSVEGWPVSEP